MTEMPEHAAPPGNDPAHRNLSAAGLATLLAALSMLGPFSIDSYLPAFPDIERSLSAGPVEVQQTLTAYLISFSAMILWHGALSDALGRRAVILASLAVFTVASLGCAAAHTIHYLWVFRILQGLAAGAGAVVGRAMIRDRYHGAEAERLMALVTMIFSIGPAVAPVLGGWIVTTFDWRAIFLFLVGYASILSFICWKRLPETLPPERRNALNLGALARSYRRVFTTLRFHLYAGTIAFNFAGLFVYVAAAPVFLIERLGVGPRGFAWLFIPVVAGIFAGALTANRMAGRFRANVQVRVGFILMLLSTFANTAYHHFLAPGLPVSVAPLFFYAAGMALAAPGVTIKLLDLFPDARGVAASCQSCAQMILASVVAGVIAPLLAGSVFLLALGQAIAVLVGFASWRFARSEHSAPAPEVKSGSRDV